MSHTPPPETPAAKKRGFALLSPERLREVASKGGKRAHAAGAAHEWTVGDPDAIEAGKKGAQRRLANRQAAAPDRRDP